MCRIFPCGGGGVGTPCKTHRKIQRKIPPCFDPVFALDNPSRVPVIVPAARVGCPYTDDLSRLPVILPAARVGFAFVKSRYGNMMLLGILFVLLCLTCLAVCPNTCNPTLPIFKSEETEFL